MDEPCDPRFKALSVALKQDGNLAALYLFGSHAHGTASGVSDIDIGILLRSNIEESRFFPLRLDYIARIMELLRTDHVDAVVLNNVPLHLAYEIVSHGILLLERDRRQRAAFEADRIGRFLDFKPFLAVQQRALQEHLRKGTFFD